MSHLKAIHLGCGERGEAAAICARNKANIHKALEVAPRAKVFKEERALIEAELDAIFISTPNFTHVPLALQVLKAGKHLFLEKPVGITREECAKLLAASKKTKRVLMIGHELRYSPYFQKIKELVDAGEIGRPRMVWCKEFRGPFQKKSRNWIQDARKSGGTLVDKNCHHFDLMNWWVGSRPKKVCAFGGITGKKTGPHRALDHATVSFEYENGVVGTLQLCMFVPQEKGEELEMGIVGENGIIQTRISRIELLLWKKGSEFSEPMVIPVSAKRGEGWGKHLGFDEIHEAFLDAIEKRKRPLTTVKDCMDGTLLGIAAEEAIRRGRLVKF